MSRPRTHPGGTRRPGGHAATTLTIKTLGEPLARIRTIKPHFFESLTIADLSMPARLTFIALWTYVDDSGRGVDNAHLVKAAAWPLERSPEDVEGDLAELANVTRTDGGRGLIQRYEANGRRYLCVVGWREHQRIDKPTASKLPAPPDPAPEGPRGNDETLPSEKSPGGFSESSGNVPGGVSEGSRAEGNREGKGKEGKGDLPVPAVGGLTDRNACASVKAPSAQPGRSSSVSSLTARSLMRQIPRYNDPAIKPWFRKHLIAMADQVLDAGFKPDAILHYASMVIAERSFAEHQHVPEFRYALGRLGRDASTGHTCRRCGGDPTAGLCCMPDTDRDWTPDDAAELERALDDLRPTDDELAQEA